MAAPMVASNAPVWHVDLPNNSAGCVVNLTTEGNYRIYAGCAGYIYRLNLKDGVPEKQNSLPGTGHQEVRMWADHQVVAGTNGKVWRLDIDLELLPPSTPPSSNPTQVGPGSEDWVPNVTSVLADFFEAQVIAACNGEVFGVYNGYSAWTEPLKNLGSLEVRLSLMPVPQGQQNAKAVLAGTNGCVAYIAFEWIPPIEWNPAQIYRLPNNSSGTVVNTLPIDATQRSFYAGCNGYVYRMNKDSNPLQPDTYLTNTLPGLKFFEVRLAPINDGSGDIVVGTNGNVLRLNGATLENRWPASTPIGEMDGLPVSVISRGSRIYAGCNGKVTCLDLDGNIQWQAAMPLTMTPARPPSPFPAPVLPPTTDMRLALVGGEKRWQLAAGCAGQVCLFNDPSLPA